jgi:hypothetical protein
MLIGDAKQFDFDLSGTIQVKPITVSGTDDELYVAAAEPKVVSRLPHDQAQLDKVAAEMAGTGCVFSFSAGRLTQIRFPRGLSTMTVAAYRDIGAALQFVREGAPSDDYTAREYDTTGEYVARYQFDAAAGLWHKQKQRYLSVLGAKQNATSGLSRIAPQIESSEGDILLFSDGRPENVKLRNAVALDGTQQAVRSTSKLSLNAIRSEPASQPGPDWAALIAPLATIAADQPYAGQTSVESLDQARIAGITFDQAVSELTRIEQQKKGGVPASVNGTPLDPASKAKVEQQTRDESRLFIALAAILREQPPSIPAATRLIRAKSPASSVLIEALGSASSPAAQLALVQLAAEKGVDPLQRTQIYTALSRSARPDRVAVDAMKGLLKNDPFNEQGLLSLGTYSRRFRDGGQEPEAEELGALLVGTLKVARTVPDRLTAIRALGNSGFDGALPFLGPSLADGRDDIRVAAVRALQSMRDPKVDELIADRLNSDPATEVRVSALKAAKVRAPSDVLVTAVETAATSAADPHVRYSAVELLSAWLEARPDVRPTLERASREDAEQRIRGQAQAAL